MNMDQLLKKFGLAFEACDFSNFFHLLTLAGTGTSEEK